MKRARPTYYLFGSLVAASLAAAACSTSTEDAPSDPTGTGTGGVAGGGGNAGSSGSSGTSGGVTPPPRSDDGIANGTETDVDCGGDAAPACVAGKKCAASADCDSQVCGADHLCAAPSGTDGVKNGDETDIDCGGMTTGAGKCAVHKKCTAHADCASDACGYQGVCVAGKSCAAHHGGDTCGAGEADAGHESCCTTIDMPAAPGGDVKLDKYNITAGRFRQFVERTNGDLRGYIAANTPGWWNASWTPFLPTQLDSGGTTPDFSGVYQELGPYVHGTAGGANEGCYINGYGARTYRIPDAVNTRMGDQQYYSQDVLDDKALNCVSVYMIAAFCAWDGGKLPTRAEINYAWGPATYPWGNTPAPSGYTTAYDSDASGAPLSPPGGDVSRANFNYNYWFPATRVSTDYSLYISAPGRFPAGNGPFSHADLAGSVFQFEEIIGTTSNWSKSGSWQGHPIPYSNISPPASNKYWATGGRCAR